VDVQIVFGSWTGGTAGLAEMVASELAQRGHAVSVANAAKTGVRADAQAVIVVGALRTGRWHGDAVRFVKRNAKALRALPVWLVSSGPLDDTADQGTIAPTSDVAKLATEVGARGTQTFGGLLDENAQGFIAKSMLKNGRGGDFRSPQHVASWVDTVVTGLAGDTAK